MKQRIKRQVSSMLKKACSTFLACMLLATMMPLQTAFAQEERDTAVLSETGGTNTSADTQNSSGDEAVSQEQQSNIEDEAAPQNHQSNDVAATPLPFLGGVSQRSSDSASIKGLVWYDANEDGIKDSDEQGIANYPVALYGQEQTQVSTTTTDANGSYSFSNLSAGVYRVKIASETVDNTSYLFPLPQAGITHDNKFAVSEDEVSQALTEAITLEAGVQVNDLNAGLRKVPLVTPRAEGGTLTVDTARHPVSNLQSALEGSGYTADDIASAATLKFTGDQSNFDISGNTAYFNNLAVTALDFSEFRGTFAKFAFNALSKITTVALGRNVAGLPYKVFERCTSLTTISDTLENAARNPGIIDLSSTGVKEFLSAGDGLIAGRQFEFCSSLTKVALGDDIETLSSGIFLDCSSLTTIGKTPDTLNEGIIDFADTGLRLMEYGGWQLRGCSSLATVTLGDIVSQNKKADGTFEEVEALPGFFFMGCVNLVTVSDTREHAQQNPGIIDLEKTRMTSFIPSGNFENCTSLTIVTLGTNVGALPGAVFGGCSKLTTVAVSLEELNANSENYGIVDLERTGVTTFVTPTSVSVSHFWGCSRITAVILGRALASDEILPSNVFRQCLRLRTITDTREHAKGESAGLVDIEKLPKNYISGGGWGQFANTKSLIYLGNNTSPLGYGTFFDATCFLPRTNPNVTLTDDQSFNILLVRGLPGGAVPDVITNDDNHEVGDIFPYYEVGGTTDGHGSIAKKSGGFLADPIEKREILEGNLASGKNYAQGSLPLTYTITPNAGYKVKSITANGVPTTPTINENDYTFEGVTDDTVFHVTFSLTHTVTEHHVDRFGDPIGLADTEVVVEHGTAYTGQDAPLASGYIYAGAAYEAPRANNPSLVADKGKPNLSRVTEDTSVWYVYGIDKVTDSGSGETIDSNDKEDLEVQCRWVDTNGNAISLTLGTKVLRVDVGSVFSLAYNAGVEIPPGWDYKGYIINDDGSLKNPDPSLTIAIDNPLIKKVAYVFARQTNNVVITHVNEQGTKLGSLDTTKQVTYEGSLSYEVPSVTNYTYSHWVLDGASQGSGAPSLTNVTAPHAIQLVYKAVTPDPDNPNPPDPDNPNPPDPNNPDQPDPNKPDPTPTPDNYEFVKKPHSKNVNPGDTVGYTFAGFGNAWGFEIERYTISDKPDKGLDFVSADLPAFTNGGGVTYNVVYFTNQSGKRTLHSNVSAAQAFSFSAPALNEGEYLTALTLEFGTVPAGFALGNTFTMYFKVWNNPPSKTLINTGILSYKVGDEYKEFVSGNDGSTAITLGGWFAQTGDSNPLLLTVALVGMSAILLSASSLAHRRMKTNKRRSY